MANCANFQKVHTIDLHSRPLSAAGVCRILHSGRYPVEIPLFRSGALLILSRPVKQGGNSVETLYLAALLGLAAFMAVLLFLGTVHPLWALADCASGRGRAPGKKGVWVVIIALTWTIGNLVYGLFFTRSRSLHRVSLFCFAVSLVAGITTMGVAATDPAVRAELSNIVDKAIARAPVRHFSFLASRSATAVKPAAGKVSVAEYGRQVLDNLRSAKTSFELKKFQISTLHLLGEKITPMAQEALRHYQQKPASQLSAQDRELVRLLENELLRLRSSS